MTATSLKPPLPTTLGGEAGGAAAVGGGSKVLSIPRTTLRAHGRTSDLLAGGLGGGEEMGGRGDLFVCDVGLLRSSFRENREERRSERRADLVSRFRFGVGVGVGLLQVHEGVRFVRGTSRSFPLLFSLCFRFRFRLQQLTWSSFVSSHSDSVNPPIHLGRSCTRRTESRSGRWMGRRRG